MRLTANSEKVGKNQLILTFSVSWFCQCSNVFAHTLQLIYDIHTVIAKTRLSFCAHTHLCNAVNWSISIFWSIYMRCRYIHCENTTQSLLIYTERQQRLCACAATNIWHSHSHCEGTTQLLHTYTSVQRSKSIDFGFLIDLHASQIHTLRRHDTVFAHIHRTTATSLRTRCN